MKSIIIVGAIVIFAIFIFGIVVELIDAPEIDDSFMEL
jgi:hypothetical protein